MNAAKKVYYVIRYFENLYISPDNFGTERLSEAKQFDSALSASKYHTKNWGVNGITKDDAIIRVEEVPGTTSLVLAKDTRRVDLSKPVVVFEPYFAPHYLKASGYSGTLQQARVFADGAEAIQQILDWSRELDWQDEVTHLINVETLTTDTQYIETVLA